MIAAAVPLWNSQTLLKLIDVGSRYDCERLFSMLTVTHWQVDPPGAVAVAGIVPWESGAEDHALHLISDSTTLSWQGAHEAFN